MPKVIFVVASAQGHYNASYKLARYFQENNWTVFYAGDESFKKMVEDQGFSFEKYSLERLKVIDRFSSSPINIWKMFIKSLGDTLTGERRNLFKSDVESFERILRRISPDLIVLDVFLSLNYLIVKSNNIRCFLFQSMLSTNKEDLIPPLNTNYIPKSNLLSKIRVELLWRVYFIERFLSSILNKIIYCNQDTITLFKRLAIERGQHFKKTFNTKRCFHYGVANVLELVASPIEFDFETKKSKSNERYLGCQVDLKRTDLSNISSRTSIDALKRLKSEPMQDYRKIIYCSCGTANTFNFEREALLFDKIVEIAEQENYIVVISSRTYKSKKHLSSLFILPFLPQLEILPVSDLIITHGGLNTIYESIFFRVPILVYPYNDSWDQRGNMARVIHHNIGLGGDIIKDTVEIMKAKIEFLLESQDVKHQLTNLSKVISKTHFYDDIILNK